MVCDISRINDEKGIDFIIDSLRQPLMTKSIYLKRRYLHEYEYAQRANGETIRAFCNRYARIERSLRSVSINVDGMYDAESRGARLLERMRLGLEQQRLILVSANQSLEFDIIREAAQVQFPDHRPTPPVIFLREFDGSRGYEQNRGQPPRQPGKGGYTPSNSQHGKGNGKGQNNKGANAQPRSKVFVAEADDPGQQQQEDDEDMQGYEDGQPDPQMPDEESQQDDGQQDDASTNNEEVDDDAANLDEVVKCLTVTARRLQGLTLGRKFRGGGGKSIQQRKAESHCAACGQKGHWQGDSTCPHSNGQSSNKPSSSSSFKGKPPGADGKKPDSNAKTAASKKVLTVMHEGGKRTVTFDESSQQNPDEQDQRFGNYFTAYMVNLPVFALHQVMTSSLSSFAEFLVLDTACQRTCCSSKWFDLWEKNIREMHSLTAKKTPNKEPFEFGHGPAQYSHMHAYLPVAFQPHEATMCLIGTSVITSTNDIPLLGSNSLLQKLGAIIDLPQGALRLKWHGKQFEVPISKINGHLAVKITDFPQHACHMSDVWQELSKLSDRSEADVEIIRINDKLKECLNSQSSPVTPENAPSTAMASGLETYDQCAVFSGDAFAACDAASCEIQDPTSAMAESPGSNADGRHGQGLQEGHLSMRTSHNTEIGKSPRKLQQVPHMRKEMEVGSNNRKMGGTFKKGLATAAAFTVLFHGLNICGSALHPGAVTGVGSSEAIEATESKGFSSPHQFGEAQVFEQEGGQEANFQVPKQFVRRDVGRLRLEPGRGLATEALKKGQQTWLLGHLKNVKKVYQEEIDAYDCLATHQQMVTKGNKADVVVIDLIEVFAGKARVSELAPQFGLSATQPFDLTFDIDLKTKHGIDLLKGAVRQLKPLLLLVAWPCTYWSLFNRNLNYSHRLDELEALRDEDRGLVDLGVDLCLEQDAEERFYLGENPRRSYIWTESRAKELFDLPNNLTVDCDAGAFGAETQDGYPVQKPHRFVTNSECIAEELDHTMTPEQKVFTKAIEGAETKRSGEYCDGLACAILRGLQREAARRNPQRFHRVSRANQVLYVKPVEDEDAWKSILDEVEKRFENTYKRPFDLHEDDPLMDKIKQLIPWKITKVQLTWTPGARRLPMDVPLTHRGCAMRLTDGQFRIEHEDLSAVAYPKQRFAEAVHTGIFFYGYPPEEEDTFPSTRADEKPERATGVTTDIYFEGGPPMSREMKSSLARLHCNLGHAPKQEIVRILAAAGKLDSKILAGLDALRCGSCVRLSKTVKPPTSSTASAVKYSGAFGDHLQADIIFIRLLTGEAIPVFGNRLHEHQLSCGQGDRKPLSRSCPFSHAGDLVSPFWTAHLNPC